MKLTTISEHTIDLDLLKGGWVIDTGCLGWGFTKALQALGEKVYAIDLEAEYPIRSNVYCTSALYHLPDKYISINKPDDRQAFNIISDKIFGTQIRTITLEQIYEIIGENIDCLKLDIEGSEYYVLADPNLRDIPKQISVEFHEHAHKDLHYRYFDNCIENLCKHYTPIKFDRYEAHGAGFNYWDCLFIRKDLI